MHTITVRIPVTPSAPRGSRWAAGVFSAVLQAWSQAASARAVRLEARERKVAVQQVRARASSMQSHDPRSAADLFAAADRHERAD